MDDATAAQLCTELCKKAGFAGEPAREPMRAWSLSAVERLRFPDGITAIFKFAREPFTHEDKALTLAAAGGVPVPILYASAVQDGVLGMIMEDLGLPVREAGEEDGAKAAVHLICFRREPRGLAGARPGAPAQGSAGAGASPSGCSHCPSAVTSPSSAESRQYPPGSPCWSNRVSTSKNCTSLAAPIDPGD